MSAHRSAFPQRGERLSRQSSSLPNYSALCRATWKSNRLWALAPAIGGPYVGTATTTPRNLAGKQLRVNLVARPQGELRVAVLDGGGNELPGFSAADCLPVSGDHDNMIVKWKSANPLPAKQSQTSALNNVAMNHFQRQQFCFGSI